ncbi:MAG: hypothetical protein FJW24_11495 [Acidimicrobiia bacterium]|nr:hypothetical protein [Acidimicrobiia bacterium]
MYVCVCHALNESQINEAFDQGARIPAEVHRYHGVSPKCGKCLKTIGGMAKRHALDRGPCLSCEAAAVACS